jgi:hypothetical protein
VSLLNADGDHGFDPPVGDDDHGRNEARNDHRPSATCLACGRQFVPRGRQLHCSDACRQRAFRNRHQRPRTTRGTAVTASLTEHTQYECAACGELYFGERWCHDCQRPCRRVGLAFQCDCGETFLLADLLAEVGVVLTDSDLPLHLQPKQARQRHRG